MKKRKSALLELIVLGILGAGVILTLLLPRLPSIRQMPALIEVSVIFRQPDGALYTNTRQGMENAADELGVELRFLTLSSANAADEQETLLLREAEHGTQALVVAAADSQRLSDLLLENALPCPVVAVESAVEGAAVCVMADDTRIGHELALAVVNDWRGGTVLLLDTAGSTEAVRLRLEAAQETLEASGIPTVRRRIETAALARDLALLLGESGAAQIMAFEPAATEQAAAGKESAGAEQPLYGVGVTANVAAAMERGTVAAAAAWSDYAAGYLAVQAAVQAAQKKTGAVDPIPVYVIRGEEMYEPNNQKLLFPAM